MTYEEWFLKHEGNLHKTIMEQTLRQMKYEMIDIF